MSTSAPSSKLVAPLAASMALLTIPADASAQSHRPPAVPLVAHDPYFSVWSNTDKLYESNPVHWTGASHPLTSLIRVDKKTYRLMGTSRGNFPELPQKSLQVLPTRTIYTFGNGTVEVKLTFTSPLLSDDVDVLSRPATYLTWDVRAVDGKAHETEVYFGASALLAVNEKGQKVVSSVQKATGLSAVRVGSVDQPVLGKSGDDLRIDWGHLILAVPTRQGKSFAGSATAFQKGFGTSGTAFKAVPADGLSTDESELGAFIPFGSVGSRTVSRHAILAYDDEYSIQFFGQNLRPWWRRNGADSKKLLESAENDYASLVKRCVAFDLELLGDLTKEGGADYAYLGSLAYRQSLAAQKVVADANGQPLMFSKENFSNGCIGTVDVLYPAAPQLLLFSPTLTKASLVPLLEYAASPRWKFPFAPHDIGTYPLANGQVYGGGERTEDNQMPVEESGNMLILMAALAKVEGNAKFSEKYWPVVRRWAEYLAEKGFDPENQLCTDDFAGHLAHNVNLSAKAIEALASVAYLADELGHKDEALKYRSLAGQFAERWIREAGEGDHFRLAFDRPGTWSQKYNLVWDRLLGFNLFPTSVAKTELAYYRSKVMNAYGLPLDNRRDYTKLDWIVWTATLTGEREDFDALVKPLVKFLDATPQRVPMTDWFRTEVPDKEGFQARSVVGGVFIKMLENKAVWSKYFNRDTFKVGAWAPVPKPSIVHVVVPTGDTEAIEWSYTTEKPSGEWSGAFYDASGWKKGPSGFGTEGTPGTTVRTKWDSSDIWIRREFDIASIPEGDLRLYIHHDEDAEVYINGVLAGRYGGYTAQYQAKPLSEAGRKALRAGRNVIAIHCHQTGGGQYIDAGFATVTPAK